MARIIKPNLLKRGDIIGIVSPSAPLAGLVPHRVQRGINMLEKLGFGVKVGKNALKVTGHTAGSPRERAEDINSFFTDNDVKAIIAFIGGNHSNQILNFIDFSRVIENPKIFIGYSDATVLHFAFHTQAHLSTFYGPAVLTQFAENPTVMSYTLEYFEKAVSSPRPIGKITSSSVWTDEVPDWFEKKDLMRPREMRKNRGWRWLRAGRAEGPIIGGCIASMMHLRGTKFWPDFSGSILFWEISESSSNITKGDCVETVDSYLTDLELSSVFEKIAGMIVGRPFGYTETQIDNLAKTIKERTDAYHFPILFNADIGHTDPMITIPLGAATVIDSREDLFEIAESGVR